MSIGRYGQGDWSLRDCSTRDPPAGQDQPAPDSGDRERFARTLGGSGEPAGPAPPTPVWPFPCPAWSGPARLPDAASATAAELPSALQELAQRLLVSDGRHGRREVRLELQDDVLPGVSVAVAQAQGRLEVDFTCSVERSRLILSRARQSLARALADRLACEVLVRVHTDDDEDPRLEEALATP